jgi:prepilin-type N-terminal cleavage/methylation domain-containing protein
MLRRRIGDRQSRIVKFQLGMLRSESNQEIPGSARAVRPGAFTLIEMLIVIGIIAMIMSIAIPAFVNARNRGPIQQAVRDFEEISHDARALAILRGAAVDLHVSAYDGSMRVSMAPPSGTNIFGQAFSPIPVGVRVPDVPGKTLPEGVTIQLLEVYQKSFKEIGEARVRFFPNGTTEEFNMVLQGPNGELRRLWLEVVSGRSDWEVPK